MGNIGKIRVREGGFPFSSPYVYANNSPHNFNDPSGLAPEKDHGEKLMGVKLSIDGWNNTMDGYDIEGSALAWASVYALESQIDYVVVFENGDRVLKRLGGGGSGGGGGGGSKSGENSDKRQVGLDSPLGPSRKFEITIGDETGTAVINVEFGYDVNYNWDSYLGSLADNIGNIIDRMGGVAVWNEMTDISAFHIVNNPAEHMDNRGNYDYVAGLSKGKDIYVSSYLFDRTDVGDEWIRGKYDYHAKRVNSLNTIAHEIGHNIFNKFIDDNYPYYPIALSREGREWTADQFSWSLGISPYHYNFADSLNKFFGGKYGWNPTGTDNDYYDSILNHYNKYLGN